MQRERVRRGDRDGPELGGFGQRRGVACLDGAAQVLGLVAELD